MTPTVTTIIRLLLAAALLSTAAIAWSASGVAGELASRHEAVATFRDRTGAADASRWTRMVQEAIAEDAALEAATHEYWQGRYEGLTNTGAPRGPDDASSLLVRANASFRQMQRRAGGRPLTVDELDRALQDYAGALKNTGFDRDAAWNYEYVARLRDAAAREKPAARQGGRPAAGAPTSTPAGASSRASGGRLDPGGLPSGPTIHGRPGTHPPSTKGEEFEVITPMDYGDREAQPEPTPGVKLPRKG
jgi:hypothetical protein